jgi:hypothetical protein
VHHRRDDQFNAGNGRGLGGATTGLTKQQGGRNNSDDRETLRQPLSAVAKCGHSKASCLVRPREQPCRTGFNVLIGSGFSHCITKSAEAGVNIRGRRLEPH